MAKDSDRDSGRREDNAAKVSDETSRAGRDAEPAQGWSSQPAEQYASGDSGGWGGPERHQTGPLPRLGHEESHPEGQTPDENVTYASPHDGVFGTAGSREAGAYAGEQTGWDGTGGRAATGTMSSGLGALFDLSFRRSATQAIAPFTYIVILVFLLLDYMRSIYDYSSAAGSIGPGALGGLVILFVVGLFKIVVLAALARLALELCQHVAQLAAARRADHEQW